MIYLKFVLLFQLSFYIVLVETSMYINFVTVQLEIFEFNGYDDVLKFVKQVAPSCSLQDEYTISGQPLNLICSKIHAVHLQSLAEDSQGLFAVEILLEDIDKVIESQKQRTGLREIPGKTRAFEPATFLHDAFLDFEPMESWLLDISSRYSKVNLKTIGKSLENRPIYVVTINDHLVEKPIICLEGGAHSREWISIATLLYIIEKLAELSVSPTSTDAQFMKFRWHILPNINPDGYVYTHSVDRFWSKNRRINNSGKTCSDGTDCCNGVNINRNFPSGHIYGPTDPCDRAFIGPDSSSEPETQTVVKYVKEELVNKTALAMSFHSFGQVVFVPYAHNSSIPANIDKILSLADKFTYHISAYFFRFGKVVQFLKPAQKVGGTTLDFYIDQGIPYSLDIELPDFGDLGFLLPPSDIVSVSEAVLVGFRAILQDLESEFGNVNLRETSINTLINKISATTTTSTTTTSTTTTTTKAAQSFSSSPVRSTPSTTWTSTTSSSSTTSGKPVFSSASSPVMSTASSSSSVTSTMSTTSKLVTSTSGIASSSKINSFQPNSIISTSSQNKVTTSTPLPTSTTKFIQSGGLKSSPSLSTGFPISSSKIPKPSNREKSTTPIPKIESDNQIDKNQENFDNLVAMLPFIPPVLKVLRAELVHSNASSTLNDFYTPDFETTTVELKSKEIFEEIFDTTAARTIEKITPTQIMTTEAPLESASSLSHNQQSTLLPDTEIGMNECCQVVVISSSGPALQDNSRIFGTYVVHRMGNALSNVPLIYNKIGTPELYLYYVSPGFWMVGPRRGENIAFLLLVPPVGSESDRCPEVSAQKSDWFYLSQSGDWSSDDPTVTLICA